MLNLNIQDSIKIVGNRFDLVLVAAFRARQIQTFSKSTYLNDFKNNKPTVLALKEIEFGLIDKKILNFNFESKINNINI